MGSKGRRRLEDLHLTRVPHFMPQFAKRGQIAQGCFVYDVGPKKCWFKV
jgi:hypothetical protein